MPLKELNYDETHFYRIVCRDLNIRECYVGPTTDFHSRKCHRKPNCNNTNQEHYNLHVYEFIRENGEWENWDMILIKTEKCSNELEARARKRSYIEMFKASLNKIKRPYVSEEEKKELYKECYDENRRHFRAKEGLLPREERRKVGIQTRML